MGIKTVITNGMIHQETIDSYEKDGLKLLLSLKYDSVNNKSLENDYINLFLGSGDIE